MSEGKISEDGTFHQLLRNKSGFAKLVMEQLVDEEQEGEEGEEN